MSRWLVLTLVVLSVPVVNLSARPAPQGVPAQGQVAETDPDYILDEAFYEGARRPGFVVRNPTVVKEVKPSYTPDAASRRLEGEVRLAIRIGVDGRVEAVRIKKSLDRGGLDLEAMKAARQWVFTPATLRDGTAVAVTADLFLSFDPSLLNPVFKTTD